MGKVAERTVGIVKNNSDREDPAVPVNTSSSMAKRIRR